MLIINADDWGKNRLTTDNILSCFKNKRITSTSAMMFMKDSERSAQLGLENNLETGLHLNFTQKLNGDVKSNKLIEYQQEISSYLLKNKYQIIIYNPLLRKNFDYVYKAQHDEFLRIYSKIPTHINGHHHMHLCMNMIIDKIIPKGSIVRRNFSFAAGEKNVVNRIYRKVIDRLLERRYKCADFFFSINLHNEKLRRILNLANKSIVEMNVHPENISEYSFLMSDRYLAMISNIEKGSYNDFLR